MWVTVGRRLALLSVPLGYASLLSEQGQPVPLANDLQLFSFRWQSLFKIGWQWTTIEYQCFNVGLHLLVVGGIDKTAGIFDDVTNSIVDGIPCCQVLCGEIYEFLLHGALLLVVTIISKTGAMRYY